VRANQIINNSNSLSQVERISQPTAGEAKLTVCSCPQQSIKNNLERPCKAFSFLQKMRHEQLLHCTEVSVSALISKKQV